MSRSKTPAAVHKNADQFDGRGDSPSAAEDGLRQQLQLQLQLSQSD